MDEYKGIALGVESAWPAFVLAVAQAVTPSSAPVDPVQRVDAPAVAAAPNS